jgi:uncharacterized membrane protein
MRRVEASLAIDAPADAVFAFVSDLGNLPTWQPGVLSAQQTSSGPVGTGATARVVRELMGQRVTVDIEVTEFEPSRRLSLASTAAGLAISGTMELEAAGSGTLVKVSTEIRTRSAFLAPLEGMAAGIARDDMTAGLQRLKVAIEGG